MLHVAVDAPEASITRLVLERALVVLIADFSLNYLAKLALLHKVERKHLFFAIRAVLKHHAMAFVFLRRFDGRPALVKRERAGNFLKHVFAVSHRIHIDGAMERPRSHRVDHIAHI